MISHWKIGILTASDRCSSGKRTDESGMLLKSLSERLTGGEVISYQIVPDDVPEIKHALLYMINELQCHLVLTTGGTGLSPRDNTPEATKEIIEKEVPGFSEMMRQQGSHKTKLAYLSRGISGIRNKTLIINLPGSPEAVQDAMQTLRPILNHALEIISGHTQDCKKIREQECKNSHSSHLLSSHS